MQLKDYTKEFSQNSKIAAPIALGQLGHIAVAFADNIMVGKLGAASLAAVSLGNSLVFIALSLGIGFSFAITPLIAEADGANNVEQGRLHFHHGTIMCFINGVFLFIALLFAKPLLGLLGQPPEVVQLSIPYLEVVALSMVPLMTFQAFKQFADGLSQTKYAMYATLAANVINVIFNYFLIYGIWVFPELGVVGAAWGTLISRFFMFGLLWFLLSRKQKFAPYFQINGIGHIKWSGFKTLFKIGLPTALQMLFEVSVFTGAIFLSGLLGTNAQAANQIALNLASFTFMFAVGLGVTATIRVGNQKGKKDYFNLRRIAFSIFFQGFLIAGLFGIMFVVFKDQFPTLYIDDAAVITLAAQLLVVAALFQLSDGVQVTILGALRGLQDVNIPTVICFIAYWIIGFPVSWYLGKADQMGSPGIWVGLLAGLTASAIMLYFRFDFLTKRLIAQGANK